MGKSYDSGLRAIDTKYRTGSSRKLSTCCCALDYVCARETHLFFCTEVNINICHVDGKKGSSGLSTPPLTKIYIPF